MSEHPRLHSIPGGHEERPARERRPDAEPLWREVLGTRLRSLRQEQQETLVETAGRAGVSPQYLSEVERGRKEPSSEMIAALAGALGTSLGELTGDVSESLRRRQVVGLRPADGLTGGRPIGSTVPRSPATLRTPRIVMLAA